MNHYWSHNFNSTSSLVGGAVVAGEAENTAIFYNPATIGEIETGGNISLAASLFSWNIYQFNNALGNGIDLNTDNFIVKPQFLAYAYKTRTKGLNVSFSALTRVKEALEFEYNDARYLDVLSYFPGDEKYNVTFKYRNDFNDTWVGAAVSHDVSPSFSYGISLFASLVNLNYRYNYSATAFNPGDSIGGGNESHTAVGSYSEYVKFNDVRLIAKFGIAYKWTNWRLGFTLSSPTMRLFSTGQRAERIEQQTNIRRNNQTADFSDFIIFDGQAKNQLKTNFKIPFSSSLGLIYDFNTRGRKFYFTVEYFGRLKGYQMVDAQLNPDITSQSVYDTLSNKDWTSFAYAANPVINLVIGYSWALKGDLVFLNALRTDFASYGKANLGRLDGQNTIKSTTYNIYHYSGGVKFNIKKNRFVAGADVAFGYEKNLPQLANFSEPEEYQESTGTALQGPIENTMNMYYFGISVYIGATLNFSKEGRPIKK